MNDELPEGWSSVRVGEFFASHSGGTPSRNVPRYWGGTIPWLSSGDIKRSSLSDSSEHITKSGLQESAARLCRKGTVLVVVRSGILRHTLPVAMLESEAAINQDIKAFDSGHDELNRWLAIVWRACAQELLAQNREGTTVQSVKSSTLKDFVLPVPPLTEQRRIAQMLEGTLGKVAEVETRLAGIPGALRRLRQSILAAACSGRLTADSRAGQSLEEGNNPVGWESVCISDVIESLKYGTSKKCEYVKRGVPVLRIPNVANGGQIDHRDLKYAVLPPAESEQLRLEPGDVLVIRSNGSVSLVGRSALVGEAERGFAYAGYLIRLRPMTKRVVPQFLNLVLGSYGVRVQIELEARSTSGVNNINSEELRALTFSLPPLAEQREILRKVKVLFQRADRIETEFRAAQAKVEKLTPSLLARAFRGELVPTEAELAAAEGRDYETAETLLACVGRDRPTKTSRSRRA